MQTFRILLLLICQLSFGKSVELLTTLQDEGLFKVEGKYIGADRKPVRIIGKSRVKIDQSTNDKIIRIIWTEVAKKDKTKYFAKPVMMTISAPKIARGTPLPDNDGAIANALTSLKDTKSKLKLKDKYSDERRILEPVLEVDSIPDGKASSALDVATQVIGGSTTTKNIDKPNYNSLHDREYGSYGSGNGSSRQMGSNGYRKRDRQQEVDRDTISRRPTSLGGEHSGSDSEGSVPKLNTSPITDRETQRISTNPENDTRVEVITEGCPVRIDYDNDRAIVQNKAVTYKGDIKSSETKCSDSGQYFAIKKNYMCENCRDHISLDTMKACPTYEKYYTNGEGTKVVLTTEPEKDETLEFPITPDGKECDPYIDLNNMLAYPQVELVYFDRVNARKVAKICHRPDSAESTPITLTSTGCTPTHNFENNWSIAQKKGIFTLGDKQYTAFGCREEGRPIPHEYDTGVCTSNVNVDERIVSVLGKRFVTIDDEKIYLSDCEPRQSEQRLHESTEGCEEQYVHKFDEGRSYLKKRWYWEDGLNKQFVTGCNKSTEFLPHHEEVTAYEHDDGNKKSKRIVTVYIEPDEDEREDIATNFINPHTEPLPYELISTTNEPTDGFVYSGCYKLLHTNKFKTYRRPDGTEYKQFIGVGTPKKSKNLCRTTKETKDEYHHTHVWATIATTDKPLYEFDVKDPSSEMYKQVSSLRESESGVSSASRSGIARPMGYRAKHRCAKYYEIYERIITRYPDGRVSTGTWSNTHKIKKGSTYYARHMGGNGIWAPRMLKEVSKFKESY